MSNPFLISKLSVGHVLPNQWTVMAYAVSDRHAVVLCSYTKVSEAALTIEYASWTVSNDDLRSTAHGHYGRHLDASFADWQKRVSDMYLLS